MWVGLGRVSFLIYLCLSSDDEIWHEFSRHGLIWAEWAVTGIPSWWEISFMNKMTSEGSINIEKCRARLRDQTLLPIISGLESIRWLEMRLLDGADYFLMRRQFEAAWAARVGSLLGARDQQMYSSPGSKTTITQTYLEQFTIFWKQPTIQLYLKTLIDRKALVMMVKQQTAVGHFENTDSTHKKVKMFRCWDEVQFSDSLMKCHQFVLKYFLLLGWSMKSFKISSFILKLVLGINYLPYLDSFNATHTSYRVFYTKIKIRLIIAH